MSAALCVHLSIVYCLLCLCLLLHRNVLHHTLSPLPLCLCGSDCVLASELPNALTASAFVQIPISVHPTVPALTTNQHLHTSAAKSLVLARSAKRAHPGHPHSSCADVNPSHLCIPKHEINLRVSVWQLSGPMHRGLARLVLCMHRGRRVCPHPCWRGGSDLR